MSERSSSSSSSAEPSISTSAFLSLALPQVQNDLLKLYERIACEKGRVEITGTNGMCDCVLISKAELEGLEAALEMLSNHDGVRAMRETLAHFANQLHEQQATAS